MVNKSGVGQACGHHAQTLGDRESMAHVTELKELRSQFNWRSEYRMREQLQMSLERFSLERLRPHCKNLVCMPKIADFRTLLYEITKLSPLHQGHKSLPAFTVWLVES